MMYTTDSKIRVEADARREFEALYRRSHKRAYNLAYRLLGNAAEAEDVTQEAYFRAWRNFARYDRAYSFEAWLYRILTNLASDCRRRKRRVAIYSLDTRFGLDPDGLSGALEIADDSANPETLLCDHNFSEPLARALAALPDGHRTAVLLADVAECSYDEIAQIMQCPVGTVRSRIHRGRLMLRRSLKRGP